MNMKILSIEDHELIREGLQLMLMELAEDVEVLSAANYQQAEAFVAQSPDLDLVLLDISLPDIDGFIALEKLTEKLPNTPIVMLSASESHSDIKRALNGLAQGYIPKSYHGKLMLSAIRVVLAGGTYIPPTLLQAQNTDQQTRHSQLSPRRTKRALTKRQQDVLSLLIKGKSNKVISRDLNMAVNTVGIHISAIFKVLNVNNRTEAAFKASQLGLVRH